MLLNSLLLILGDFGCFVDLEVAAIRQQACLTAQRARFVVVQAPWALDVDRLKPILDRDRRPSLLGLLGE